MESATQKAKAPAEDSLSLPPEAGSLKTPQINNHPEAGNALLEVASNHAETSTLPENGQIELTRQELLNAIDFEIGQRESTMTRHGITVWGIVAAVVGLFWGSLNEILDNAHVWINVLLVLFVACWGLNLLTAPWITSLNRTITLGNFPRRRIEPKDFMSLEGLDPNLLPFSILENFVLLLLGIYLGFHGFWLLATSVGIFQIIVLFGLGLAWAMCHVSLPINLSRIRKEKKPLSSVFLVYTSIVLILAVGILSIESVWGNISKADFRLGLILAGLLFLFTLSLRLTRPPPGISVLRSLRSRVGFGLVGIKAAREEADNFLLGSREDNYVVSKADAVILELNRYIEICNGIANQMERFALLAEKLKVSPEDNKLLREIVSEFRPFVKHSAADRREMDKHAQAAVKARSQLNLRIEAAKFFLETKPDSIAAILARVDTTQQKASLAHQKLGESVAKYKPSLHFLFEKQRGVNVSGKMTYSDLFAALFKD